MSANRRDFMKFVVAGAVASGCPIDQTLLAAPNDTAPQVEGEENRICHEVRDGHTFTLPPATKRHDVVIVGGGISGLTAAHLLSFDRGSPPQKAALLPAFHPRIVN